MKPRYRVFRRTWGTFYCQDQLTGKQESLHTCDKAEAYRLVAAKNETSQQPAFSLHLARVYWKAGDPAAASRTWQQVMVEILKLKQGNTHERWSRAIQDSAFNPIREMVLLETHPYHFLKVLEQGSVSTNVYLRRIHNFAVDMNWLPWPILPKKRWPVLRFKEKRAITWEEHQAIVARENKAESQAFYELLWETGGSQSDVATLMAEYIDRRNRTLVYSRHKTKTVSRLHFGARFEQILERLPQTGLLFPRLAQMHEKHRAQEFRERCRTLGITGVTLHSYRYAWGATHHDTPAQAQGTAHEIFARAGLHDAAAEACHEIRRRLARAIIRTEEIRVGLNHRDARNFRRGLPHLPRLLSFVQILCVR